MAARAQHPCVRWRQERWLCSHLKSSRWTSTRSGGGNQPPHLRACSKKGPHVDNASVTTLTTRVPLPKQSHALRQRLLASVTPAPGRAARPHPAVHKAGAIGKRGRGGPPAPVPLRVVTALRAAEVAPASRRVAPPAKPVSRAKLPAPPKPQPPRPPRWNPATNKPVSMHEARGRELAKQPQPLKTVARFAITTQT